MGVGWRKEDDQKNLPNLDPLWLLYNHLISNIGGGGGFVTKMRSKDTKVSWLPAYYCSFYYDFHQGIDLLSNFPIKQIILYHYNDYCYITCDKF